MTASDAPSCGITYDHHSDDSRGVIYDCNVFIIQATEQNKDIVCTIPMQHFQNVIISFATAVSYASIMFMKLTTGPRYYSFGIFNLKLHILYEQLIDIISKK